MQDWSQRSHQSICQSIIISFLSHHFAPEAVPIGRPAFKACWCARELLTARCRNMQVVGNPLMRMPVSSHLDFFHFILLASGYILNLTAAKLIILLLLWMVMIMMMMMMMMMMTKMMMMMMIDLQLSQNSTVCSGTRRNRKRLRPTKALRSASWDNRHSSLSGSHQQLSDAKSWHFPAERPRHKISQIWTTYGTIQISCGTK